MSIAVIVLLIGLGASFLSMTNLSIAQNVRANAEVRYLAEAALDATIAYIRTQPVSSATAVSTTLVSNASSLDLSDIAPPCPSSNNVCIEVTASMLGSGRDDLIQVEATSIDSRRNSEYDAHAIVHLRESSGPFSPDYTLLSDGVITVNGLIDLSESSAPAGDTNIIHGNDGYILDDDNTLPVNEDGNYAVSAGTSYSTCDGKSFVGMNCRTASDVDVASLLLTPAETFNSLLGSTSYPSSFDNNNVRNGDLASECRNGDVLRYKDSSINVSSVTLGDCIIVRQAGGDLSIEGNTAFNGTTIVAKGKIEVKDNVTFADTTIISDTTSSGDVGVNFNSDSIEASNALIISNGKVELNANFSTALNVGIYSGGEVKLNGNSGFGGFVYSLGDIIVNGQAAVRSSIISTLLDSGSSFEYDSVISRN
ncbi:MAG: hypothetical protein AB4040_10055 [Synechococcus sp.]